MESEPENGNTCAFTLPVFDVDFLVPLYFDFLKTSRHGFQNVAVVVATAGPVEPATSAQVERSLNRQLRSRDLLLRLNDSSWLACIACDDEDLAGVTGQIERAYAEHNCNRPNGALPEISFRQIGRLMISSRPEELTMAVRSAYALDAEEGGGQLAESVTR